MPAHHLIYGNMFLDTNKLKIHPIVMATLKKEDWKDRKRLKRNSKRKKEKERESEKNEKNYNSAKKENHIRSAYLQVESKHSNWLAIRSLFVILCLVGNVLMTLRSISIRE